MAVYSQNYLNKCDTIGRNGDVISELVKEVRRDSEGCTTKPELITPERVEEINTNEPQIRYCGYIKILHYYTLQH